MAISNPYTAPQAEVADVDNAHQGAFQEMRIWGWRGRLGRLRFLAYGAVAYLVFMLLVSAIAIPSAISHNRNAALLGIVFWVSFIPYMVFWVMTMIRRSHDMGWPGWSVLLAIIPLAGLIWVFKAGDATANEFGPPPPPNGIGVKIAAFGIWAVLGIGMVAAIALPAYQQYVQRAQAAKALQGK